SVDRLVYAQQKLVGGLVAETERMLKQQEQAEAAGDKRRVRELEDEIGLALLRAERGYPKNKRLIKLKGEPGVEQLLRKTEFFYLQDNAKRMPEVDDVLYFALDEKQHSLELTDKGREEIARAAGSDVSFFVIPDVGEEIARIEREFEQKERDLRAELEADASLSDE